MWSFFLQGFIFLMALIVPIGPKNMMGMKQGIGRQYFLLSATLCFNWRPLTYLCRGIRRLGACHLFAVAISRHYLGQYFVPQRLWFFALCNGWHGALVHANTPAIAVGAHRLWVLLSPLAVTLLNLHIYLDMLVIPGSVAGQIGSGWFSCGLHGLFYGLALIAVRLALLLIQPPVQSAIQWLSGIVMWCVGLKLLYQGQCMFRMLAAFQAISIATC